MNPASFSNISAPLLDWYRQNARSLPWRDEPTPYRVWISEIMLQQTRVEAVKPYFERFLQALPDVCALAEAKEETCLKLWEGLGYYSRVRNLHRAACLMVEHYGGELPRSYDELLSLPGIGPYTAGAVASIACGIPVPAVDGNVLRVVTRLTADSSSISDPKVKKQMEESLRSVVPADAPGAFNQALMELGATVCLPNGAPQCEVCPLREQCAAHAQGNPCAFPVKAAKKARRIEQRAVLLLLCNGRLALRRRPDQGLLAGLWELPNERNLSTPQGVRKFAEKWGISVLRVEKCGQATHIFTHMEWHMTAYRVRVEEALEADGLQWVTKEELEVQYTLPSAFRPFLDELQFFGWGESSEAPFT